MSEVKRPFEIFRLSVPDGEYNRRADLVEIEHFYAERLRADTAEAELRALEWKYNNQTETIRQYQDKMKSADQCILDLKDLLENLIATFSEPDDQICCGGHHCGCMGTTKHQQVLYYAKETLAHAALNPNPEGHYSDCATNNRGVPELLGPCDCGYEDKSK